VDGNASASLSVTLSIVGVTMQDKIRTVPIHNFCQPRGSHEREYFAGFPLNRA
jgi:hypothetical protein